MELIRVGRAVASRLRQTMLRLQGMRFEGSASLRAIEWPLRPSCVTLGDGASLDRAVVLLCTNNAARLRIGARCYVNRGTFFDCSMAISVGDDTMIGPGCYVTDHDHAFGPGLLPNQSPLVESATQIGAGCWLGVRVVVLKGVTIGDGSVVGAGSVVTKSLPARVLALGSPAKVIRHLDSEECA
jgi:acetyltransferase-like isoleucine patch superfamily enzyme